jgi:hypothetical protein
MPKTFYTERDIDDLLRQGVQSLIVDDDVVLTDLAYERARKRGLELLRADDQPPGAPIRPYIAKLASPSASGNRIERAAPPAPPFSAPAAEGTSKDDGELFQRVYQASLARLGDAVDPNLLRTIIQRVLANITAR